MKKPSIFSRIKWFYQRGKYGWADCDLRVAPDYLVRVATEMMVSVLQENDEVPYNPIHPVADKNYYQEWFDDVVQLAKLMEKTTNGYVATILYDDLIGQFGLDPDTPHQKVLDYVAEQVDDITAVIEEACDRAVQTVKANQERVADLLLKHFNSLYVR